MILQTNNPLLLWVGLGHQIGAFSFFTMKLLHSNVKSILCYIVRKITN